MSDLPTISIVVPNFNNGATLGQTIQSLLDQQYPKLEIVVADGGSKDNSVEVIKQYEQHLKWWCSEKDRGQSHAINKGFAHCTGDVVNWLCSDDQLMPGALHIVGKHFAADPSLDVLLGSCQVEWEDGSYKKLYVAERDRIELMPCTNAIQQPSCFYRRTLLDRTPPIDESYHYLMDVELWMHFKKKQVNWKCIDDVLSLYILCETNKTTAGGKKIRTEWQRLYNQYTDERVSLFFWYNALLLPLDHLRKRKPSGPVHAMAAKTRLLVERVLGKFYGFSRVHALDLSWTIK